jgi:quercetin dioxygenase-like cupin family protein
LGFSLWNRENIAVQRVFLTTDTEFPPHTHQEHEYIILISGSMRMIGDGIIVGPHRERVIEVGGGCYFMPLHPHGFEVLEDSWVLGVTIPASEAYPGGK